MITHLKIDTNRTPLSGVGGCHCAETLALIAEGKIDTTPLITHTYPLRDIEAAYELFENRSDGVIKVAVTSE